MLTRQVLYYWAVSESETQIHFKAFKKSISVSYEESEFKVCVVGEVLSAYLYV